LTDFTGAKRLGYIQRSGYISFLKG